MTGPAMRVSRTHFPVLALGPGTRLGVWVQGCPLACRGCMALDTWDAAAGTEVGVDALVHRWQEAVAAGATGLTVSGGEPLAQPLALAAFLDEVARLRVGSGLEHDILLYTGHELDELDDEQQRAITHADVLVTGRFRAGEPTDLLWRGSANQSMVLRTELGRRRYGALTDARPADPPMQVQVDSGGAWLVGVPRRGALQRLDASLRAAGLSTGPVTWRPAARPTSD